MGFNPPKPAVDTTLNPKFFDALTPAPTWTVNSGQGAHSCKRQGWDGGGMPHQQEFANNSDPRHPHHSRPLEWRAIRQVRATTRKLFGTFLELVGFFWNCLQLFATV